jgi:hypothetical protein
MNVTLSGAKGLFARLARIAGLALVSGLLVTACREPTQAADRVKVGVEVDGLYRLTAADLRPAGFDLASADQARLRLTNRDRPVPLRVVGQGREQAIEFYGTAVNTRYTGTNVYWLDISDEPSGRLTERPARPPTQAGQAAVFNTTADHGPPTAEPSGGWRDQAVFNRSSRATIRFERNALYWSKTQVPVSNQVPADRWYWQSLTAPVTVTLPFSLVHYLPESSEALGKVVIEPPHLRVTFLGATHAPDPALYLPESPEAFEKVIPDHRVVVAVNGQVVGQAAWDGQALFDFSTDLPAGLLRDDNRLTLTLPGTPGRPDLVLLDRFEVSYLRALIADTDRLLFDGTGGSYQVTGFSAPPIEVFDVTDPLSPTRLSRITFIPPASGGDIGGVAFTDNGSRRYLVVGPSGALRPAWVAPGPPVDLRTANTGADYIVIAHPSLLDAVKPLTDWRRSQGLRVVSVTIDQVYDAFSDGLADPAAIRAFLRHARATWPPPAPRFVLLVGAASYDYRGYLAGPNRNLVPTVMLPTAFLGEAPSDNWLAALDEGSPLPSMAIGRLPARTAAELAVAVSKIVAYDQAPPAGDWRQRLLFVADDKEPTFARFVDDLAGSLPAGLMSERIYLKDFSGQERGRAARERILAEFDRGALAVTYVGHGAIRTWAAESIFSADDVSALKNGGRLPLLITPTCLDGFFAHPKEDSLAEELLWWRDGGIIAGFVPTGLTLPGSQDPLIRGFYEAVFKSGKSIGEAVLEAKRGLPDGGQGLEDVIETFTLLGDPATRLANGR